MLLTVIIPVKQSEHRRFLGLTLRTLKAQTSKDFQIVIVYDRDRGASWARNEGTRHSMSEYILFSDDDVMWHETALERMSMLLVASPDVSFVYGPYEWIIADELSSDGPVHHRVPPVEWDPTTLRLWNYVSTMSMIRRHDFIGFDEQLERLQDWDLWLRMAAKGHKGKLVSLEPLFRQIAQPGITLDADLKSAPGFQEAKQKLVDKGLILG